MESWSTGVLEYWSTGVLDDCCPVGISCTTLTAGHERPCGRPAGSGFDTLVDVSAAQDTTERC